MTILPEIKIRYLCTIMTQSEDSGFLFMAAPLQGFTEAPLRHWHREIYGGTPHIAYFTPFIRIEKGEVRARDMRDLTSPQCANHSPVAQVIARNGEEFATLVGAVAATGCSRIDLNAGCPFPPQVHKGRGAGLLGNPDAWVQIAEVMQSHPAIQFSIKMRLGIDSPDQWRSLATTLVRMPLAHITIHPRTARQQYSGELHLDEIHRFISEAGHPVVFNGDIASPADIDALRARFPSLAGVMAGRGLLRRPSLYAEYALGEEWTPPRCRAGVLSLHREILSHYASTLCGDNQVLLKIKPLWDYIGTYFPRKELKRIIKSRSLADYIAAVEALTEY